MCGDGEKGPPELPRAYFVGQPLKVKLDENKLEAVVDGRSKKLGDVCTSVPIYPVCSRNVLAAFPTLQMQALIQRHCASRSGRTGRHGVHGGYAALA